MIRYGLPPLPTGRAVGVEFTGDPAQDYNTLAERLNALGDPMYLPLGMRLAWADLYSDKPVLAIRCDDIPAADVTSFANLRARHLTAGMAVVESNIDVSGKLTLQQARDIQQQGFESMNHSKDHSNPPPADDLLYNDIVAAAYRLRARNLWCDTFVLPGFYDGVLSSPAAWDEPLGRAVQGSHIAAMAYVADGWKNNVAPRGFTPYGANYAAAPSTAVDAQDIVDKLVAGGPMARTCVLWHNGSGATDPNFFTAQNAALDVFAAARDAGQIRVMTPTGMLLAKYGQPVNFCPEPSFSTLAVTADDSVWQTTVGTAFGTGDASDGASVITTGSQTVTLNMGAGIVQALRCVEVIARARAAGGTGTATARVINNVKNGSTILSTGGTAFTQTFPLTSEWSDVRLYIGTDPAATNAQLSFGASAGTSVEWDNIRMFKV